MDITFDADVWLIIGCGIGAWFLTWLFFEDIARFFIRLGRRKGRKTR